MTAPKLTQGGGSWKVGGLKKGLKHQDAAAAQKYKWVFNGKEGKGVAVGGWGGGKATLLKNRRHKKQLKGLIE